MTILLTEEPERKTKRITTIEANRFKTLEETETVKTGSHTEITRKVNCYEASLTPLEQPQPQQQPTSIWLRVYSFLAFSVMLTLVALWIQNPSFLWLWLTSFLGFTALGLSILWVLQ